MVSDRYWASKKDAIVSSLRSKKFDPLSYPAKFPGNKNKKYTDNIVNEMRGTKAVPTQFFGNLMVKSGEIYQTGEAQQPHRLHNGSERPRCIVNPSDVMLGTVQALSGFV